MNSNSIVRDGVVHIVKDGFQQSCMQIPSFDQTQITFRSRIN